MRKIKLTEEEREIFSIIKNYAITIKNPPVPRAAGGWVRDKILNKESHDIDIALDTVSGYDFAVGLNLFRKESILDIGVVKSNPDKSKHLETAVLKINNYFIDFVCLRTEEYSNTRIPKVLLGTPQEDALRRDLTINSLFYNIFTQEIEDFTGNGISDIQNKVIRTPIDPLQTFYDDPLRILRAFRFSCRFSFRIHDSIYKALEDKNLSEALKQKVSNERIGVEIKKIITYEKATEVFNDFIKFNLIKSIFKPEIDSFIIKEHNFIDRNILNYEPNIEIKNLYYVLIFYTNLTVKRKKEEFVNTLICKESLKYPNKLVKEVNEIEKGIYVLLNKKISISKVNLIKLVRELGEQWKDVFYFAILFKKLNNNSYDDLIALYNELVILDDKNIHRKQGVLDGNDVISYFNVDKLQIKDVIEDGIIYKIINPNADKEEVLIYLKAIYQRK